MDMRYPDSPRRSPLLLKTLRPLLHPTIRLVVTLAVAFRRAARPVPIWLGLLVLLGATGIGLSHFSTTLHRSSAETLSSDAAPVAAGTQLPPSTALESYLLAQAEYDAEAMWNQLSDQMTRRFDASESSPEQLQVVLDEARLEGRRWYGAVYVGGVPIEPDSQVYFYVLTVESPAGTRQVPFAYVIGRDGKIVAVK